MEGKREKTISLKIGDKLLGDIARIAVENDRTLSSMIRVILAEYARKKTYNNDSEDKR